MKRWINNRFMAFLIVLSFIFTSSPLMVFAAPISTGSDSEILSVPEDTIFVPVIVGEIEATNLEEMTEGDERAYNGNKLCTHYIETYPMFYDETQKKPLYYENIYFGKRTVGHNQGKRLWLTPEETKVLTDKLEAKGEKLYGWYTIFNYIAEADTPIRMIYKVNNMEPEYTKSVSSGQEGYIGYVSYNIPEDPTALYYTSWDGKLEFRCVTSGCASSILYTSYNNGISYNVPAN